MSIALAATVFGMASLGRCQESAQSPPEEAVRRAISSDDEQIPPIAQEGSIVEAPGYPPAVREPSAPPVPPRTLRQRARQADSMRSPLMRLASVPNMFGDVLNRTGQVQIGGSFDAVGDIPTAGVLGRSKIADNNKAVTMDRIYVMYNHFHNAVEADVNTADPFLGEDYNIDRYTLGFEKRFLDQQWSVDLRLPLVSRYDYGIPKFGVEGDEVGNLALILKRQLLATCTTGVVAGLGIDVPLSGDVTGHAGSTDFIVHNDALHLSPYLGLLRAPDEHFFWHAFAQVDIPLNGNQITYVDSINGDGQFGKLTEQTLLHADLSGGYWLYRNQCAPVLTGLASVIELHYSTALQDADLVSQSVGPLQYQFGNLLNRFDTVQMTVGLHAALGQLSNLRVGGAFPLNGSPERPFDAELLVSLNRRF